MGEGEKPADLKRRTKQFALRVIKVYCALPQTTLGQTLGKQLLRAGTSVGAHYREACRSRSDAEFVSTIEGGLRELDETDYWLELVIESGLMPADRLSPLVQEAAELNAILTTCVLKVKARLGRR